MDNLKQVRKNRRFNGRDSKFDQFEQANITHITKRGLSVKQEELENLQKTTNVILL